MENKIEIKGQFGHIIYYDKKTRYTVARFRLYELNEKMITVTGYLPDFPKDLMVSLSGKYIEHPRFGLQFVVSSYRRILPTDTDSIVSFLSSPLFVGIGKKFAEVIVETLGEDCLDQVKENPDLLKEVKGYTEKKKQAIIEGFILAGEDEEALRFFSTHGFGIRNVMRLERVYGKKAYEVIKENPYRICDEVDGIGFKTADKLALSMGFELNDIRRLKAACTALVMDICMRTGDSYVEYDLLVNRFTKQFPDTNAESIIEACLVERKLVDEDGMIFPVSQYIEERYVARILSQFPYDQLPEVEALKVEEQMQIFENEIGIHYDDLQKEAIHQFFSESFMILTGGPGTGKTTVVGAMIHLFKRLYPSYSLACIAPTGRAAKRLSEINEVQAYTIHSLLKWDLETNTYGKNEEDPLEVDVLIIDEFSMVDTYLFAQLLKASQKVKKILIVGDRDQLPSVAPGNVLSDLIESNQFHSVALETIYRQESGSDVISLAQQIRQEAIDFSILSKDIQWFEASPYEAKQALLETVSNAIDSGYSIHDFQVLAPMYSGVMGIDNLNHNLQKLCNPQDEFKREHKVASITFREGDKILQLKNQPMDDVFNGDIGELIEIVYAKEDENKQNRLVVDFDGRIVEYTSENILNITLAYCISVHKAQGSEYPIVMMPILKEHSLLLRKRLLYTAITRASKKLLLFGDSNLFINSTKETLERKRCTRLLSHLSSL